MVTAREVRSDHDRRVFRDFDLELYRTTPVYAPPVRFDLDKRLKKWTKPRDNGEPGAALFLAEDNGKVVGRIAASIDQKGQEGAGSFGFYESIDNREVGQALFEAAEGWLKARGVSRVLGPYSFTQEDPYVGFLTQGYETIPSFGMTYSMPWYPELTEAAGYETAMDLKSYTVESEGEVPDAIVERATEILKRPEVKVRHLNMKRIWDEAKLMKNIFNSALKDNWEFIPFDDDMVKGMVEELRMLADPRLILFVEVEGKPAACVINIPDYNDVLIKCRGRMLPFGFLRLLWAKRRRKKFRAYAMGTFPEYRREGLGSLLVYETFRRSTAAGYRQAEVTWILGSNGPMNELAHRFADDRGRAHRLYEKKLN